jgi:excisionase family DNA binding protein
MADITTEFVSVSEAAERTGINPHTLDRRLSRGEIEVYRDNRDRRRRLIRVADLDRLAQPVPLNRIGTKPNAGMA